VHPVYPAKAWGVDPLYFDGSVSLNAGDVERTAPNFGRIWLLSATADQKLYASGALSIERALRQAGFTPTRTQAFRGVDVTEEVRS
jgi:hypothetical protein